MFTHTQAADVGKLVQSKEKERILAWAAQELGIKAGCGAPWSNVKGAGYCQARPASLSLSVLSLDGGGAGGNSASVPNLS